MKVNGFGAPMPYQPKSSEHSAEGASFAEQQAAASTSAADSLVSDLGRYGFGVKDLSGSKEKEKQDSWWDAWWVDGYNPHLYQQQKAAASGISLAELMANGMQLPQNAPAESPATLTDEQFHSQKAVHIFNLDEDTLVSYALPSTGLCFYIKYAENSTEENPVAIAKGFDENGNAFEETIYLNDVDPYNATVMEFKALEAHITGNRGGISRSSVLPSLATHDMGRNDRANFIDALDKAAKGQIQVGEEANAQGYFDLLEQFLAYISAHK